MSRYKISFLAAALLPVLSNAASFDCAKAGTSVERLICSTPELSKLDETMAVDYLATLKATSQFSKDVSAQVKAGQISWLGERHADANALLGAYRIRVGYLHRLALIASPSA